LGLIRYLITVLVAQVLEDVSGRVDLGGLAQLDLEPLELDLDDVGHGLCVGSGAGSRLIQCLLLQDSLKDGLFFYFFLSCLSTSQLYRKIQQPANSDRQSRNPER